MRYENLHKHTHFSNVSTIDSVIKPEDIAKRAVELGHKTLSTVEHGFAGDVFEYYDIAKQYGLKMVFGVEFYYVHDRHEKDRTNAHLLILAKTNEGKRRLTMMITEAGKTGYYHKPRIDRELLFALDPKDVVVTSTCIMSPYRMYDDECFIKDCWDHFGDSFFLEIHDNTHHLQVDYNKKLLEMHEKYGIPFIFATDTHYIHEDDDKYRTLLLRGKNIFYPEEEGFILDYPEPEKVFERFEKQGVFTREQVEGSMRNTWIVDDFEDIVMNRDIKMPSIYPHFNHEQKIEKLSEILYDEWEKDKESIPEEQHEEYLKAIEFELDIIKKTSTEDYFLLNYPIIKKGKEYGGILTRTGRGSAPSFYLNKLLGFTEVDRLSSPVTLYPTRFMSVSRILETKSLPDIDFNCANPEPFIRATKEILGEDNCYYMLAYGTMQESAAFRNLCRAYGMEESSYNEIAKELDRYKNHAKWKDLINESKHFIGVIDSVSHHPCAHLLLSEPISESVGVMRISSKTSKKITYCAIIDSDTSDAWKYLKNDLLTVTVWQIISEVFKSIGQDIPDVRELTRLVEGNEKVWELYEKGFTATLNQTGTDAGTPQIMQYKPKSVRELTGWISAIRPSFASMKQYFLNRVPFSYGIKEFDEILKESDNFVLYQENIMATLVYAGFPEDETYGLLKAISKKKSGIIEPIYQRFMDGFIAKTGSKEQAVKVWKILEDAVGYGFNSSHAYSVALDSLYGAYLKATYPLDYYATALNIAESDTEITGKLMGEIDYFGISVESIEFGKSRGRYAADHETNTIYKGIGSIKNMSEKIGEELYEFSNKETYDSFVMLLADLVETTSANKTHIETLIKLNYFSQFGDRQKLMKIYTRFRDGAYVKYDKKHKDTTKIKRLSILQEIEEDILAEPLEKVDVFEQVMFEKDALGYVITKFPEVKPSLALITDVNKRYKPKVTLLQLSTGEEFVLKVDKMKFYDQFDQDRLYKGDVIEVEKIIEKSGWKKVDDDFVEQPHIREPHLEKCRVIRYSKLR